MILYSKYQRIDSQIYMQMSSYFSDKMLIYVVKI